MPCPWVRLDARKKGGQSQEADDAGAGEEGPAGRWLNVPGLCVCGLWVRNDVGGKHESEWAMGDGSNSDFTKRGEM